MKVVIKVVLNSCTYITTLDLNPILNLVEPNKVRIQ